MEHDEVVEVVSETTYPKLVAVGENPMELDSVLLCVDGQGKDVTLYPMNFFFFTLHASYYVFSIVYPQEFKDFFFYWFCFDGPASYGQKQW